MEIAVLLASGLGERMRPVTERKPKPLVSVAGKPMIETVIAGLLHRGVGRIYIVAGYLLEQFFYLEKKYQEVTILKNPDYRSVNNISSIYYARHVMRNGFNCFVCEADLFVADLGVFQIELSSSCYFGKMVKGYSDDWVFTIGEDGYLTHIGKGGEDCYNMAGIAYLTGQDAGFVAELVEAAYGMPGYEILFWDEVVDRNLDKLKLQVYPIESSKVVEIDTMKELKDANARFYH